MKRKTVVIGVSAVVTGILAACGGETPGASNPAPPSAPPSTNLSLTTNELLMGYAEQPSETASPVAVNGGVFGLSDTSETSSPISVNGS
jgi:hypothetical protein